MIVPRCLPDFYKDGRCCVSNIRFENSSLGCFNYNTVVPVVTRNTAERSDEAFHLCSNALDFLTSFLDNFITNYAILKSHDFTLCVFFSRKEGRHNFHFSSTHQHIFNSRYNQALCKAVTTTIEGVTFFQILTSIIRCNKEQVCS